MITVKELIDMLSKLPPEAVVVTEGCDCDGLAENPYLQPDGNWGDYVGPLVYIPRVER
jgi:hypothetical protein